MLKNRRIILSFFVFSLLLFVFAFFFHNNVRHLDEFITTAYWFFALILILSLTVVAYIAQKKRYRIENVFLLMACAIGFVYLFLFPPQSPPDELSHMKTAYTYSNMLLGHPRNSVRYADVNKYYLFSHQPRLMDYIIFNASLFETVDTRAVVIETGDLAGHTGPEPFYNYLFSALGIALGRLLGLGIVPAHMLGRLFNLSFFIAITFFAIKYMPFCKMLIFSIALLPMTMHVAASFSTDAILNGLAFFLIAYILHLAYEKEKASFRDILLIVAVLTLIAPNKGGVYLPLAFLCLLIPREKLPTFRFKEFEFPKFSYFMSIFVPAVAFLAFNVGRVLNEAIPPEEGVWIPGRPTWETFSVSEVLLNPIRSASIFVRTIGSNADFYILSSFGNVLGWLEIPVQDIFIMSFVFVTFLSVLTIENKLLFNAKQKMIMALISVTTFSLTLIAMLIFHTWYGAETIWGVQGRYFLPVMPLIFLIFNNSTIIIRKRIEHVLILSIGFLQAFTILDIFNFIIKR